MLMPARAVVHTAVSNRDRLRHANVDAGGLLFDTAIQVDQTVLHQALGGIIGRLGSRCRLHLVKRLRLLVLEERRSHGIRVAHKTYGTRTAVGDMAARDFNPPVVPIDKYPVAPDLIDTAVAQLAGLGAAEQDRPAAICRPITSQQRLLVLHECSSCMGERKSF